ncbi:MAG TPA: TAXI family TRAP transporter solute-binding subunit [Stellaceae bacterium]|nr:TAXI family TRAP transporter solute-binding subunit [Stellaceae bacterium]
MEYLGRRIGIALAILFHLGVAAAAAEPQVTLRAGKGDNPNHALAMEFAATLNRPGSGAPRILVEESQGSVQNVIDAAREHIRSLFTAPPNVIVEARRGDKPYGKNPRYQDVRALFPIPFQTMHWVVRKDSQVQSFADLAGKPFIPGTRGSFGERQTAALLKILGLENKLQLIDIDSAGASQALKSNQVIGFALSGAYPIASLKSLAGEVPLQLLSLTPDEQKQLLTSDGTTVAMTIPKGTYPGIDQDVATVALPAGVYTTRHMSENEAYHITKAFWTGRALLAHNSPVWQAVTPDWLGVLGAQLHPGALKYYREAGIKVPPAPHK